MAATPTTRTTPDSQAVRDSLSQPEIHRAWEDAYRTDGNERFYEMVFDELVRVLPPPIPGSELLDAGCGVGANSLRIARRGFTVRAVDFSDAVLEPARQNVRAHGLEDRIQVERADLLALPYDERAFTHVVCWGVLMHVPDIARAVAELARVTASGGAVAVNEINARAPEARLLRAVLPRVARSDIELKPTPAGIEHWTETPSGPLMWRHADLGWLVAEMASHGLSLRVRRAAQLSELYTRVRVPALASAIHALNTTWFRRVRWPGPALGNLLVFERG
jgi:ubiquinone/menaquinone biosynthesis C-methylase UbiE